MWNYHLSFVFFVFLALLTLSSALNKVSFAESCDGYKCHKNKSSTSIKSSHISKHENTSNVEESTQESTTTNNTNIDYPEYSTLSEDLDYGNSSDNEIGFDLSSLVSDEDCKDFPKKSAKCCEKHPDLKWCQRRSLDDGTNEYAYDTNNIYGIFKPNDRRPYIKSFPPTYPQKDSHLPLNVPHSYRPSDYPINPATDYLPLNPSMYDPSILPLLTYSPPMDYQSQRPTDYQTYSSNPSTVYEKSPPSDYNSDTSSSYLTNPSYSSGLTREICLKSKFSDPYCCKDFPDTYWCGKVDRTPMIEDPCKCVPKDQCQYDISAYARELKIMTFCNDPSLVCCPKSANTYVPPSTDNCGHLSPKIANSRSVADFARVLDRDYAVFGEFPWMAALLHKNYTYVCGAVLIDNYWAATAAHCVKEFATSKYILRLGKRNLNDDSEPAFQEPKISKVIIHPDFNARSLINDIALLKLESSVKINDYINIVCLPPDIDYDLFECKVSGWGKDSLNGSFSEILKKVKVPLISHKKCENMYKNSPLGVTFNLHSNFLCAGERLKDACKGDGGSPLVCKVDDVYRLVGLVSWGVGCGNDFPGVYTKITSFVPWILNIIKNANY